MDIYKKLSKLGRERKLTKINIFRRTEFKIFLTVWIVYLFFISTYAGSYISEPTIHQAMSIVDKGSFQVDSYMKDECKLTGCDYSLYNGHYYSGFAPGTSLFIIPFYLVIKPFNLSIPGSYTISEINTVYLILLSSILLFSLLSALLSVLIYSFVLELTNNKKNALIIPFIFAFGTLFFVYSGGFYPRIISAFLVFLSFYLLFKYKDKKNNILFISGFISGLAVTLDFPQILTMGLLFLYLLSFSRNKKIIYFILGAAIPLIILAAYNYHIYDSPLPSAYEYRARIDPEISAGEQRIEAALPSAEKAFSFLFSLKYGLFIYMPILFMSLFGFWYGIKNKKYSREILLFLFIFLLQFLFYISYSVSSPCSFGPRYFLPVLSFLIIPIIFLFDKTVLKVLTLLLSFVSIFINFLGTSIYYGCVKENILYYFKTFFTKGLSSYTLTLLSNEFFYISDITKSLIVIIALGILSTIIYFIWKK